MKHYTVVLLLACVVTSVVKCQNYDSNDYEDSDYSDGGFAPQTTPPPTPRPPVRPRPTTLWPQRPTTPPPNPDRPPNPGVDKNGQLIGCPCVSTQETNSVCGTDGNTYGNMGKLRCAQRCGHPVELNFLGRCTKKVNV